MKIKRLKHNLMEAQKRVKEIRASAYIQAVIAAFEELAQAERALAAAKGHEYATPIEVGIFPEAAVSGPILLQDDNHAFLAFNAMRPMPDGRRGAAGMAIAELERCGTTRFGYPNDEARPGHPLAHRGLGGYGIYEVINSSWIDEHLQMNRVCFPKTKRSAARHFMFTFHDSTLECIARDIKVEVKPYSPRFQQVYEVMMNWWESSRTASID